MDGTFFIPDKIWAQTDVPAVIKNLLPSSTRIGILVGLVGVIVLMIFVGIKFKWPWIAGLSCIPAVSLGVMYVIQTADSVTHSKGYVPFKREPPGLTKK
jgi:hypothetical protein